MIDNTATYNPCDDCKYGVERRNGSGNDAVCKICEFRVLLNIRAEPANEPLTCEGCMEKGQYENEVEYGYPSPCTRCKRRSPDNYRRKPEPEGGAR